jgi:hypothetical protein
MDFNVDIEYWESSAGECPIENFILNLPANHQTWIAKKDIFFEKMTVRQLMKTMSFEKAKGTRETLWELKYAGSKGMNYRMLCIIHKQSIIGLELFKGSGSGGMLRKYFEQAIHRAQDWKIRNP